MLTSVILATVVYGLFVLAAFLRIRRSLSKLRADGTPGWGRVLSRLDLAFSAIFLVAAITFYAVFITHLGR